MQGIPAASWCPADKIYRADVHIQNQRFLLFILVEQFTVMFLRLNWRTLIS